MPVYEYQCKACGREFEYQQRMSDPDMTTCEACGGGLERLISRTAFQLKGGGWYKDLYSSTKPAGSDAKSDKGGDAAASSSASAAAAAASDKPAAKSGDSGSSSSGTSSGGGSSSGSGASGGSGASASGSTPRAAAPVSRTS